MTKAAGKTGAGPTVSVAIEQHFPPEERILDDDLAYRMLPGSMRALVWMTRFPFIRDWFVRSLEKPAPGVWAGLMARKRYIDDRLLESVDQVDAAVNLGAGLDTRAYRLRKLAATPIWEVDQPENIAAKRAALHAAFGEVPAHVTLVAVDFDHESLGDALARYGYQQDRPTFFIVEAVTQYLTDDGITALVEFLAGAAPGSKLALTYVLKEFLDGSATHGQDGLREKYVTSEELWLWGMGPAAIADFLADFGWRVIEHPTYEELSDRYVTPTGRHLASTPIERMVYAEKV